MTTFAQIDVRGGEALPSIETRIFGAFLPIRSYSKCFAGLTCCRTATGFGWMPG